MGVDVIDNFFSSVVKMVMIIISVLFSVFSDLVFRSHHFFHKIPCDSLFLHLNSYFVLVSTMTRTLKT